MIERELIKRHVDELIASADGFLVDVQLKPGNKIFVYVDSDKGISIDNCSELSRELEKRLNRDEEDFDLVVSTPGIDRPFSNIRQYKKYIGREIKLRLKDGTEKQGELTELNDIGIKIFKPLSKNRKKKLAKEEKPVEENFIYSFDEIEEAKGVVSFKQKQLLKNSN